MPRGEKNIHILVFLWKKIIWYCAGSPCPGSTGGLHKKAPWNCEKQTCQDKRCKRDAIVDDDTHVYDLRMIARNTIQHMWYTHYELPYLHLAQCNTIIFNALSDTQCILSRVYEKM